ncbi:hypothetical protein SAMN05421505_13724 [Sinosporangium album]|uniref:Ribosomal protein L7/L12 C-terminal domain-containing protein n=1 Tax=Sinosporangium album TaxID=504805 RepID=A0A1G8IGP1_9ACTN|nr:hypothetical protein [Sinosporangium album]SDI18179.1 hypothetical protein SAMN05421505_13724 [Sinosporangium album]
MPIGLTELLILLAIVLILAVLLAVLRRNALSRANALPIPLLVPPADLRQRVESLLRSGQKLHALKLIRAETGLGLREAKYLADAVETGATWNFPQGPPRHDLASRVRELKEAGHVGQAVHVVCWETGMEPDDARRFVDAL